jgi:hypothetical protein
MRNGSRRVRMGPGLLPADRGGQFRPVDDETVRRYSSAAICSRAAATYGDSGNSSTTRL